MWEHHGKKKWNIKKPWFNQRGLKESEISEELVTDVAGEQATERETEAAREVWSQR